MNYWKACFYTGFIYLIALSASAQNQAIADSLSKIYQEGNLADSDRLELLSKLAFNESNDLNLAIKYADELITLSQKSDNYLYLHRGYFRKGNKQKLLGKLEEALDSYFKAADAATKVQYNMGLGSAYSAIASVYNASNNHRNAMLYFHKAIVILRQSDNPVSLASTILNAGEALRKNKEYDSALLYFSESAVLYERANYLTGKAYNLGNAGMAYAAMGNSALAEKNLNEAIQILEGLKDYYPICAYLVSMADIYVEKGEVRSALTYADRSLKLAMLHGLKEQVSEASLKLSQLHDIAGNSGQALKYYKAHIAYRDSVNNVESVRKMGDLRTNYEVSQKQVEVDLLNQQKKTQQIIQISSVIISVLIIGGLAFSYWLKQQSNKKLQAQQVIINERNDQLQELNAEKDKLFSIIGHDLKGPLASFKQVWHMLSNRIEMLTSDERSFLLSEMNVTLQNQFKLLENLLEWARSQIGHIDFNSEGFDMDVVLKENKQLLLSQATEKNISIVYNNTLPLPVRAHQNSMNTVVRNLLSNAIKFTPAGGVITLGTEIANNFLTVSVADTGVGIKEKALEKLFKVGTHHTSLGTANEKGTGLGLMLCKEFVEKNGGSISVESQEGKGSTFSFTVPV